MHRSNKILLVEDNPDDVELARRAFRKINVTEEIAVASDGAAALAYMMDAESMPSLVLLDLQLPKVHGLDVLRRLRAEKRTRRVPIVMLTSSREERDIQTSYDLGANSFIHKPVDFSQFLDTAKTLIHYWLRTNEPPEY